MKSSISGTWHAQFLSRNLVLLNLDGNVNVEKGDPEMQKLGKLEGLHFNLCALC